MRFKHLPRFDLAETCAAQSRRKRLGEGRAWSLQGLCNEMLTTSSL
ncbi:hypothetical protein [Erythrobacter aurantius]|nr:hypothetical protein [Erythrobacter aurantius]